MTIDESYRESVARLRQELGVPRDEAASQVRQLIDDLTQLHHAHLTHPHAMLDARQLHVLGDRVAELARGKPLAYILGKREFFGLSFKTDERALVPRPETETLVETAIARLRDKAPVQVADLGTGTGCIAISIAHALPDATVYATDISEAALNLARENATSLQVADRVKFQAGKVNEWAAPLLEAGCAGKFDVVLTNPPYIALGARDSLQPQIRDWEPSIALFAGVAGIDCYRSLAAQCHPLLKPGGFLMAELGDGLFDAACEIFASRGWTVAAPIPDLAGIERVLVAESALN